MSKPINKAANVQRTAAVVSIVIIFAVVILIDQMKKHDVLAATSSNITSSPIGPASSSASVTSYKDATYSASSGYSVPHSYETIEVTLTVQNGVVTDSQVTNSEGDRESADFQERFTAEYKSQVVGQSLANLNLSTIAGASDTTDGFNQALQSIRDQAQT